ncbi:MAG: phosphoethanolamine transferase [Alphaproteobacteria bacterium]|nr:phosphoethanolamine transferase [Alphaproteobacteria bacterium]
MVWVGIICLTAIFAPAIWIAHVHFRRYGIEGLLGTLVQAAFLYAATIAILGTALTAVVLFLPLAVALVVLNFLNLNFYLLYGQPIRESMLAEILKFNPLEWREFAHGVPPKIKVISLGYAAASLVSIGWLIAFRPISDEAGIAAGVLAIALLLAAWMRGFLFSIYPMKYIKQLGLVVSQGRAIKRLRSDSGREDIQVESPAGLTDEVFIVVIGESVRRSNLSIYGYDRETTPFLDSIEDELIVFDDAISVASVTHAALKFALTPALIDDEAPVFTRKTLLNAAGNGGLETHWISNQPRDMVFDYVFEVVAEEADHKTYLNTDPFKSPLDEALLPFIFGAIDGRKPCLVMAHMFGSHFRYDKRVSDQFRRFTKDANYTQDVRDRGLIVDNYDNTILYLDHFLEQIISACREREIAAVVGFISDHGEALFDNGRDFGHALVRPSRKEFEVPYLYWASPHFRNRHPNNPLFQVARRVTEPAETQLVFEDLSAIIGLTYDNVTIKRSNLYPFAMRSGTKREIMSHGRVHDFDALDP